MKRQRGAAHYNRSREWDATGDLPRQSSWCPFRGRDVETARAGPH
jgi:hypothetical protein